MNSYNASQKTKLLETACRIQSLLGAGHVFDLWQIILKPTW